MFCTFSLANVLRATAACNFGASDVWKVGPDPQFFSIFTCKCAFRHSGVQFFDIASSKSASELTCFAHFHFQMCFSPQRRAFFRHLNFKKCSDTASFLTFSLPNMLFATAACNFSTSGLQKSAPRTTVFSTFSFPNVLFATAACNFSTSELQKVLRRLQFFNIFTSKCAFRHSGASKSAPKTTVFQHCPFQICSTIFDIRTSKSAPRTTVF